MSEIKQRDQLGLTMRLALSVIVVVVSVLVGASFLVHRALQQQYNHVMYEGLDNNVQFAAARLSLLRAEGQDWNFPKKQKYIDRYLNPFMENFNFHKDTGLVVLDRSREMVISQYPKGLIPPTKDDIHATVDSKDKVLRHSKNENLLSAIYMPSLDVYVISYLVKNFATDPFTSSLGRTMIALALPAGLVALLLLFLVLRYNVLVPLQRLTDTMAGIVSMGSYDKQVQVSGSREIQMLAEQFNKLLSYVNQRNKKLRLFADEQEELVKERTAKLEEAHKQLVQKERLAAVGEFTASVVHELRNPLTSIKLGVSRLKQAEKLSGNDQERLALAQKQTERLEHMLSEILDFSASRPTACKPIHLQKLLKEFKPLIEGFAEARQLVVREPDINGTLKVKVDRDKLQQVWLNVVKNACDASSEKGDINIEVTTEDKKVYLAVKNSGDTIPKSALERLFEPFFTTKSSGTGLGLPVCKKLMTEMEGDITIESDNGQTTVTLVMEKG